MSSANVQQNSSNTKKVIISGGGPAGLLLAHYLAKRPNYEIHIYEKKSDPTTAAGLTNQQQRTFPISLQHRGLDAIREIDNLEQELEKVGKWIVAVCIHGKGNSTRSVPRPPALSVERHDIALVMLKELKKVTSSPNTTVSFHYDTVMEDVNLQDNTVTTTCMNKTRKESFDYLVAADGAQSAVRASLAKQKLLNFESKRVPDDYKTLYFNHRSDDGTIELGGDNIHCWIYGTNRIISVPVKEDYCSGVIIFERGQNPFADMTTAHQVHEYFEEEVSKTHGYNSVDKLISELEAKELLERPVSSLWSVKCNSLHVQNKVLLIGDAAHAVSASLGQGCNSALEDVRIFCESLTKHGDDWKASLESFNDERLPCAHAVRELSDYATPRTTLMRIEWILRTILRSLLPTWFIKLFRIRPLPFDILDSKDMTYRQILEETKWWIDRVKRSSKQQEEEGRE